MPGLFPPVEIEGRHFVDGATLVQAVRATFKRRRTPLPEAVPVALTEVFFADRIKATQWRAFLSKTGTPSTQTLREAIAEITVFLMPVLDAARSKRCSTARYSAATSSGRPRRPTGCWAARRWSPAPAATA